LSGFVASAEKTIDVPAVDTHAVFGFFTPTEASGVGVFIAFVFGVLYTRDLNLRQLGRLLANTARQASVVRMLVAGSAVLGEVLADQQLPQAIASGLGSVTHSTFLTIFLRGARTCAPIHPICNSTTNPISSSTIALPDQN
jgi:H+/gluconate symporter-like permease